MGCPFWKACTLLEQWQLLFLWETDYWPSLNIHSSISQAPHCFLGNKTWVDFQQPVPTLRFNNGLRTAIFNWILNERSVIFSHLYLSVIYASFLQIIFKVVYPQFLNHQCRELAPSAGGTETCFLFFVTDARCMWACRIRWCGDFWAVLLVAPSSASIMEIENVCSFSLRFLVSFSSTSFSCWKLSEGSLIACSVRHTGLQ